MLFEKRVGNVISKKKAVECQIGRVISIQINTEKSCAPDMGLEPMTLRLKV